MDSIFFLYINHVSFRIFVDGSGIFNVSKVIRIGVEILYYTSTAFIMNVNEYFIFRLLEILTTLEYYMPDMNIT